MGKKHNKISFKERESIFSLLKEGCSVRGIGKSIGRSPSTISEELRRNGMNREIYSISEAQVDRNVKSSRKGRKSKLIKGKQPLKIIEKWLLKNRWSPEQIAGRLKIKFKNDLQKQVSHEAIYRYIYSLENQKEKAQYIRALRRKRKKRYSRKGCKYQRGPIANITSIHERPLEVELRIVPGHWEGDSLIGKDHKSAIGTLVERKFRYTKLVMYGSNRYGDAVARSFAESLESIPNKLKKTLTFDRGAEMSQHKLFTELSGVPVYFADPGCPGQRGTNENTNGLIREFFPKKTDFSKVTAEELRKVEDMLNDRPKKILGYRTPREMMTWWIKRKTDPPQKNTDSGMGREQR